MPRGTAPGILPLSGHPAPESPRLPTGKRVQLLLQHLEIFFRMVSVIDCVMEIHSSRHENPAVLLMKTPHAALDCNAPTVVNGV